MTEPDTHDRPRPLLALPVGVVAAPGKSIDWGDWYLAGWSLRETTGAAVAQVDLIDGGDANGVMVGSIALAAGGAITATMGGHLLVIRSGLFLAVNAGSVTGALWVADRAGELQPRHRRPRV